MTNEIILYPIFPERGKLGSLQKAT